MSPLSFAFTLACLFVSARVLAFDYFTTSTGTSLDCSIQACQNHAFSCISDRNCTVNAAGFQAYNAEKVIVDGRFASSLHITCGVKGVASATAVGGAACTTSIIRCPLQGTCNVICQGRTSCQGARVFCPQAGACQISCEQIDIACKSMRVYGAEGAAPTIIEEASTSGTMTDMGLQMQVICPDGTTFENAPPFKSPSQLVCPMPTASAKACKTTSTQVAYDGFVYRTLYGTPVDGTNMVNAEEETYKAMPATYHVAPDDTIIATNVIRAHDWNIYRLSTATQTWGAAYYGAGQLLEVDSHVQVPNWETDGMGNYRIKPGSFHYARLLIRSLCEVCPSGYSSPCPSGYRELSNECCEAYGCNVAVGIGCATCVAEASRTSDDDCATCNPGYDLSGTNCQVQNCSMGDNCRYCRDGAVVLPDPQSPGHLLHGGGHCVLNSSKVCVDIYTHLPCSSDASACPPILHSNVEGEYLEPAWYQTCSDEKRNYVMGPAGCNGGVDSVGICKDD